MQESKETRFIVLFDDSQTWSSDDYEFITGNSFVIPQSGCDPKVWEEVIGQNVHISERSPPKISIPEMIRELKRAGRWDNLVREAMIRAERSGN